MADIIQLRRDTIANWTTSNPILANGEQGYETDTGKVRIGDGVTAFLSLTSWSIDGSAVWGLITGTLSNQTDLQSALDGKEPADATILKDADIGVTVQAYDATILVDADIGVNVQAYDATILVDADIGVNVQAYDATILVDADIGVNVEAYNANIQTHVTDITTNPHAVTQTQVGLGNVDNTSDANKPVSTAQQTALDLKVNLTGGTMTGQLKGITPVSAEDLTRKDYTDKVAIDNAIAFAIALGG